MKIGDRFVSRLHEVAMKPAGFKKNARTFSRLFPTYGEHYNIQGSAWNSAGEPWRFYINCAISFPDLPQKSPGNGMWKFHANTRLGRIVPESQKEFDVSDENLEKLVKEIALDLFSCSNYFSRRNQVLRDSYIQNKYNGAFLDDPELRQGRATISRVDHQ